MDKNTILGLLMMGALIFGFMQLQKPSEADIERQRQEQADRLASQNAASDKDEALDADTFSMAEAEQLRNGMRLY
nr:hypothetical protein [Muribaculaceae bacterium]